jgi:hypothetical protein
MIGNEIKSTNNGWKEYKILYNNLQTFKLENLLHTTSTNYFPLIMAHQPINTCLSIISTNKNTNTTVFLSVAYLQLMQRKRLL